MPKALVESRKQVDVTLPYGAEGAWETFLDHVKVPYWEKLTHGMDEREKRAMFSVYSKICTDVRNGLAAGDIEAEFIRAVYLPIAGISDNTGLSGLVNKMIGKRLKNDFSDTLIKRTPGPDYANRILEHPKEENGVRNFAFAIDSNNLRSVAEVSFARRPRHLLVGTTEATSRFLIGAAASFRSRNAEGERVPIIVAIGDRKFTDAINAHALDAIDVTLQTDSPNTHDETIKYLADIVKPTVRGGQPVYFSLQDAGAHMDITAQIVDLVNEPDLSVALAAGVTAPGWNATKEQSGLEPLEHIIQNATSVWFGKEAYPDSIVDESERLGLPPGISDRLTPHMMVQVAPGEPSSSIRHTFWWPIGGNR